MKKLIVLITFIAVLSHGGCKLGGLVGIVGSPTQREKKIPAEFDLAARKDQKILILVNQPGWLDADVDLRRGLTEAISVIILEKVKIKPAYLIGYDELSEFRSNKANFSLFSAADVGAALDADMVLLVVPEAYQLTEMGGAGYYKGFLGVQTVLLDAASGEKLWPGLAERRTIRVGFEIEDRGREIAIKRLMAGCAHCIVRYFYNCPMLRFKISDDRSDISWESWSN
ncbi:MAG: hypothetical protein ACYSU6_01945 [Planctomycetota bacterium]|jgi:hypothetical protein